MKKLFFGLIVLLFAFAAYAADENGSFASGATTDFEFAGGVLIGEVTAVNKTNKTFTVKTYEGKTYTLAVTPATEIEWKYKKNNRTNIDDVKTGLWVKTSFVRGEKVHTAKDIYLYDK